MHHRFARGLALTGLPVVVTAALSGCASSGDDRSGGDHPGRSSADCVKAATARPPDTAGTTALVVDNTASTAPGPLPPAIRAGLVTAQRAGDRLAIVTVEGDGVGARISRSVALDPSAGRDSQVADNARTIVLDCVTFWARERAALPTAAGSDVLEAVTLASRERPARILVVSDGLANAGDVDLNRDGFDVDPRRAAAALAGTGALAPTLHGAVITWAGLGQSRTSLRQSLRASLQTLWTTILTRAGASVTFDSRSGGDGTDGSSTGADTDSGTGNGTGSGSGSGSGEAHQAGAHDEGARDTGGDAQDLPADGVSVPQASRGVTACGAEISVPSALLFAPDSARLQPGTDEVLRDAAATMTGEPRWDAVVAGHTADYGSAEGQLALSRQRAEAVVAGLAELGVARHRMVARGFGASRPAVPEFHDGQHDASAATRNRRVVITMGPKGCRS